VENLLKRMSGEKENLDNVYANLFDKILLYITAVQYILAYIL